MEQKKRLSLPLQLSITIGLCLLAATVSIQQTTFAINPLPEPPPKPGSYGIEATKKQPPPKQGATITVPGNGASFTESPITVSGICPDGLLVQVYNNGVMVGSVMCRGGSFSVQVSLFSGTNELSALVYDDLDQAGPASNTVTVTYTDTRFTAFGALITLTSAYGRRSAPVDNELGWPLQLSGGTGPYAFSIDWGDGSTAELKSQSLAGLVNIAHVYKKAGIYQVNVKVADVNQASAFLQVISVANGEAKKEPEAVASKQSIKVIWVPAAVALILLFPTYWLGGRSKVVNIRKKMLKERDKYEDKAKK